MLNHFEWERYIATTAARGDLDVVWEKGGVPRTDGKTIWLPMMDSRTTHDDYMNMRHAVTHEVEHNNYSDFKKVEETGVTADRSLMGAIWNSLEDHRIEALGSGVYEGDKECHNEVHPRRMEKLIGSLKGAPPEIQKQLLPFMAWLNQSHGEVLSNAALVQRKLEDAIPPDGKAVFDKLQKGNYRNVLRNSAAIADKKEGTESTYELAKRIFKEVFDQDPEEEEKRCQAEAKAEAEGKGKGKGEGEGDGEGEGEGKPGEGGDDTSKKPRLVYGKYMLDEHEVGRTNKSMTGIKMEARQTTAQYTPPRIDQYKVTDFTGGKERLQSHEAYNTMIGDALRQASAGFAHQIRTVLQVRARDRYHYGQKRGKLNTHQLHRITTCVPGYSERVFKRKEDNNVLDAAVTLLIDHSGSMSGEKFSHAAAAAIMLNDTIANTLHIPTEILGFTNGGRAYGTEMSIYRTFKDRLVSKDDLKKRFCHSGHNMSSNLDGEAIIWSFDRIMKRPEKRKLIIVFSDGQPAGSGINPGDICWYTRKVISEIETLSPVDIVGVGIMHDGVEEFYKEHTVIRNVNELERGLLNLIENKLK